MMTKAKAEELSELLKPLSLTEKYSTFQKSSSDIWEEFTTGNKYKKKIDEIKEQERIAASKKI
jgi:hypothetical protein